VLFRVLPPGDVMEITVIDGEAVIDGVVIPEGYKSTVCLSEPDNRGVDGQANDRVVSCAPSDPVPLENDDVSGWCTLGDVPASLLNYPVPISCEQGLILPTPTPPPPPVNVPPPPSYDCSTLVIGGPTEGMQAVTNTFWWYGVEGATHYNLTIYDAAGNVLKTATTEAPTTWIDIDGINPHQDIQWGVDAYRDGTLICGTMVSQPVVVVPPPPPPFAVTAACSGYLQLQVNWSGAKPGDTINISIPAPPVTLTSSGSGASGSVIIGLGGYTTNVGTVTASPSGFTATIPGGFYCP
jgi:hypothetical protein